MKRLFIANRGEVAARIIRTASLLGIETVLPYVPSESSSPVRALATHSALIPPGGYLDAALMVEVAKNTGCDALHPGYGFLSESADFSRLVGEAGIVFVGPSPESMRLLGDKAEARKLARSLGVPVAEGVEPEDQSDENLFQKAKEIGFPLLIKSAAGGGGRGMRKVLLEGDLLESLRAAKREALAGFGNPTLLLERFFENSRHVEVQIIGDGSGAVAHLFERDCTIQRRYQKLIEESPAPRLSPSILSQLYDYSVKLGQAGGLRGLSTVEFLVNPATEEVIFLEVNCRLQVEHPVTEEILGADLVELQLRVADGEPLQTVLRTPQPCGAAIEVRVVAEDRDFLPSIGSIYRLKLPKDIRIEHTLSEGMRITGEFDSLLAKVIARGATREQALQRLGLALEKIEISGISTNLEFLRSALQSLDFTAGKHSSTTINQIQSTAEDEQQLASRVVAATQFLLTLRESQGLRVLGRPNLVRVYTATIEGREFRVETSTLHGQWMIYVNGNQSFSAQDPVQLINEREALVGRTLVTLKPEFPRASGARVAGAEEAIIRAGLSGRVANVRVNVGDRVTAGQVVVVIESMKMEHSMKASSDGIVSRVLVKTSEIVQARAPLVEIAR